MDVILKYKDRHTWMLKNLDAVDALVEGKAAVVPLSFSGAEIKLLQYGNIQHYFDGLRMDKPVEIDTFKKEGEQ